MQGLAWAPGMPCCGVTSLDTHCCQKECVLMGMYNWLPYHHISAHNLVVPFRTLSFLLMLSRLATSPPSASTSLSLRICMHTS